MTTIGESFPQVKDYKCPKCGTRFNDDESYVVDNIEYPQIFDEYTGWDMDGSIHDWSELHCCENCGTKFWFRNGEY